MNQSLLRVYTTPGELRIQHMAAHEQCLPVLLPDQGQMVFNKRLNMSEHARTTFTFARSRSRLTLKSQHR